jgi:hypothetical protein
VELASEAGGGWEAGRLPFKMTDLAASIRGLLQTGTGANVRLSGQILQEASALLSSVLSELTVASNRDLVRELQARVEMVRKCISSRQNYAEAEWAYREVEQASQTTPEVAADAAVSQVLVDVFHEVADRLAITTSTYWHEFQTSVAPRPSIIVQQGETVVTLRPSLEVDLPFKIGLATSYAPASHVRLVIKESSDFETVGAEPSITTLESGTTEKLVARVVVSERFLSAPAAITVKAQLKYLTPANQKNLSAQQTLRFTLNAPESFKTISNPFAPYAGGTTVTDPAMFFGRESLLNELVNSMQSGPPGQCYALYGQKRSGKSSLLAQIKKRVCPPAILVQLSFGTIDHEDLLASFVRDVLQQLKVAILERLVPNDARRVDQLWPDDSAISRRPLESLKGALIGSRRILSKYPGWAALRYVLLVDEFTYLFEVLRRSTSTASELAETREFMRKWKALLDTQVFSAVVVGQDTLPYAMRRFANEFSNMTPKRLSYLDPDETRQLADQPIQRSDGRSRYVGYALDRVHEYTDGHPFFAQILCDRLVRLANQRQRGDITEGDVEEAIVGLIEGINAIDLYRFDCFLNADNTGLPVDVLSDDYGEIGSLLDDGGNRTLHLLIRLANLAGAQNRWVSGIELSPYPEEEPLLADLVTREVVSRRAGEEYRIRVLLFADYLRRAS